MFGVIIAVIALVAIFVVTSMVSAGRQTSCINTFLCNMNNLIHCLETGSVGRDTFEQRKQVLLKTIVESGVHTDESWFISQCTTFYTRGYMTEDDINYLIQMSPIKKLKRDQGR